MITAMSLEPMRAIHAEATAASEKRRRARLTSTLKILGVVLLLAAIAS